MKNILAICDREKEYAHRLMEYISRKKSVLLKPVAFSARESLLEFAADNSIELLLIGESMYNDEISSIESGKTVLIKEDTEQNEYALESVYKYQSADKLLKEIMTMYDAERNIAASKRDWRRTKQIIGVYSPVGGTRKTSFALTMGQLLAKETAVLYMNLEGFSGLSEILGMEFERGLSDLLYFAEQKDGSAAMKLSTVTISIGNLDIVPPADSPEDIHGTETKSWVELLDEVMSAGTYNVLVLDIGTEVNGLADLIDICSCVYVPTREDKLAEARIDELEKYLKANSIKESKIKKVKLPFNTAAKLGRDYFENLVWSQLGDYTRKIIKEGVAL